MKKFALIPVALLTVATMAPAQMNQDKSKRPSPPASAECKFSDGKTVKIDYSKKTAFTLGAVKTNFGRFPLNEKLRFLTRAAVRHVVG